MKHDRGTRSELGRVEKNEVSNLKASDVGEIYIYKNMDCVDAFTSTGRGLLAGIVD